MKKEIKLYRKYSFWKRESGEGSLLCVDRLNEFFDIPDDVDHIIGVLSTRPSATAYPLKFHSGDTWIDDERVLALYDFDALVKGFGGICYGHIEWEVK